MNSNMEKGDMVIKAHWEGRGSNTRLYLAVEGIPDILQKMFFGMMQGLGVVPTEIEGLEEPRSMDLTEEREETIALITEADLKDVEESIRLMEQEEAEKKSVVSNATLNREVEDKHTSKGTIQESVPKDVMIKEKSESVSATLPEKLESKNTHVEASVNNGNVASAYGNAFTGTNRTTPTKQGFEINDSRATDNSATNTEIRPSKQNGEAKPIPVSENGNSAKTQENAGKQGGYEGKQFGNTGRQSNSNSSNNTSNQRNNDHENNYRGNYGKNNNSNSQKNDDGQQSYQKSSRDKNGYKGRTDQLGPQSSGNHKITEGDYKGMTAEEVVDKHRLNAVAHFYKERKQKYYGGVMKKEIKVAVQKYVDTITNSINNPEPAINWLVANYGDVMEQELKKMRYGNTPEEHMRFLNTESVEVKASMAKTLFHRLVKEI